METCDRLVGLHVENNNSNLMWHWRGELVLTCIGTYMQELRGVLKVMTAITGEWKLCHASDGLLVHM